MPWVRRCEWAGVTGTCRRSAGTGLYSGCIWMINGSVSPLVPFLPMVCLLSGTELHYDFAIIYIDWGRGSLWAHRLIMAHYECMNVVAFSERDENVNPRGLL